MLVGKNLRRSTMTGGVMLRSLWLGVSVTGLMLAGTALAPASAQVLDLGGATVNLSDLAGFTEVTNGTLRLTPLAGGLTFGGALTDSLGQFSLTKLGITNLTLTGSGLNTFSGNTTLSGGILIAGANNILSANSLLNVGGGALDLAGFNQTVNGLTGSGQINNTGGLATLTINSAVAHSFSGAINGATRVVKSGAGDQTFVGASTYTGGTELATGLTRYGNNASFGTGAITVSGVSAIEAAISNVTLSNDIILDATLESQAGGVDPMLAGVISGNGGLRKVGNGNLTLANVANTFTGGFELIGGQLVLGGNGSLGTGALTTGAAQVTLSTLGNISVALANDVSVGQLLNFELPNAGNFIQFDGVVSGAGGLFLKTGGGALVLTNANTYAGNTLVQTGFLGLGNALAAGATAIEVSGTGGLAAYAPDLTVNNLIRTRSNAQVDTRSFNLTLGGVISNQSNALIGGVEKIGAGTLTLTGANTYTGPTTVTAGQLDINGSLTSNVAVASGATLGGTGSVAAANTVTILSGGNISPGGAGFGTLTFGTLDLQTGSIFNLDLSTVGVLGGGVNDAIVTTQYNVGDGAILSVNFPGAITPGLYPFLSASGFANIIGGGFTVNPAPGGFDYSVEYGLTTSLLVTFSGVRFWDGTGPFGNSVVNGGDGVWTAAATNWTNMTGAAQLAWANTEGVFAGVAGTVTVDGTQAYTNLRFDTAGYTLTGGSITANGGVLNIDNAGTTTINSVIAGTNGLTKTGAGTLVLGGANTFTGIYTSGAGTGVTVVDSDTALGTTGASFGAGTTLRTLGNQTLTVPIAINGGVTFDQNGALLTVDGVVSGNSALTVLGAAALPNQGVVLLGVNTYTGTTTVMNAGLAIEADSGLGNSANGIVLNGGVLSAFGTFATSRSVSLQGNFGGLFVDTGETLTSNGLISGGPSSALVKGFGGTLILGPGANTYQGPTVLQGGTLQVSNPASLGTAPVVVFAANSTLRLAAPLTLGKALSIQSGVTGTVDTAGFDSTINGVVIENLPSGTLTKVGLGQLTLNQAGFHTGGTNLNEGTLRVVNGAIGAGTLTTTGGTRLVAGIGLNQALTFAGVNGVVLGAGNTTLDLVGGSFSINTDSGVVTSNGTTLTINRAISGPGGFTNANAGVLNLNAVNSYAGGTTLSNAAVFIGNNNALGTGSVTLNNFSAVQNNSGGALSIVNDVNIAGAASPAASSIAIGGANDLTVTGALSGAGGLNKSGAGTLTLANAANTNSGILQVNQGTLSVTGALTSAAAVVNVRGDATIAGTGTIAGTVNVANAGNLSAGVGATPGTLTIGNLSLSDASNVLFDLGAANTIGGPLNDRVVVTGALTLDGRLTVSQSAGGTFGLGLYNLFTYGTLTNNGLTIDSLPNGFSGIIQNNVGQSQINLVVGAPGTNFLFWDGADTGANAGNDGGTNTWTAAGFNWTGAAPSQINTTWVDNSIGVFGGTAGTVTLAQNYTAQGLQFQTDGYVLTGGGLTVPVSTGTFVITDPGITATINSPLTGAGALAKQGTGTLVLGGNNNYSGGTALTSGTLGVASNTALGTGALAMADGTTLQATTTANLANAIDITGTGTVDTNGNILTLAGVISGSTLTKVGAGVLQLNNANTYTGGTNLNAETIFIGNSAALGTGALAMADGTTLRAGAAGLSLANGVAITGTGTFNTNDNILTLGGVISGGTLNKTGGGTLIVTNANSFTGGTTINAGTVTVANNLALGTGLVSIGNNNILNAGVTGLTLANNIELSAPFGGVGSVNVDTGLVMTLTGDISSATSRRLRKSGGGELVLFGTNLTTNGTNLVGGTVTVGSDLALGPVLTMAAGTTLAAANEGRVLASSIVLAGNGTIDTRGFTLTVNGRIENVGSLTKISAGTLVLNGANTYTGGTNLNAGTIQVGNNTALGTGALAMADGTTLLSGAAGLTLANAVGITGTGTVDTNGNTLTLGGIVTGNTLAKTGAGTLVLTGANTYTGGTSLNAGTITVAGGNNLGSGTLTAADGTTLRVGTSGGQTIAVANNIVTNGVLTVGLGGTVGGSPALAAATGLLITDGNDVTLSGIISGAGSLVTDANAPGNLTLSVANTYSGGTTITQATVSIGTATSLGSGDVVLNSGGVINRSGGALSIANNIASASFGWAGGADDLTLTGVLSGGGNFFKVGSDKLTLANAANTFGGVVDVAVGNLNVNGALTNAAGSVIVRNGSTLSGTGSIAGAVTIENGGNLTPGNSVGTLTVGSLTLNNTSNVNFEFGAPNTIGGAFNDLVIVNGDLVLDGLLNVTQSAGGNFTTGIYEIFQYSGNLTDNILSFGSALPNGQTGIIQAGLVAGQVNLIVTQSPSVLLYWDGADGVGNGVISGGTGTWTALSTNWTGAPPSALNTNWQSTIGVFQGVGGTVTINDTQSFEALQFTVDGYNLVAGTGGLATPGAGVLFASTGIGASISAPISGAGSIVKQGGGTITLSGDNSYAGGTDVQIGTLAVGSNTALGTGQVLLQSNATLAAAISGVVIGNNITTFGNGIVNSGPGIFTLGGTIDGAGSISQVGTGNLVLNGNNSFTNLGINQGTVTVGTNTAAGIGSIAINNNATLAAGANNLVLTNFVVTTGNGIVNAGGVGNVFTLNGNIAGAGSISQVGPGTLVLNGNNSFTNLGINAGMVQVGSNTAAGIGSIALNNNATLQSGGAAITLANNVETTANGLVNVRTGEVLTLNGSVGGAGSISQVGPGTLVLNGNNSFTNLGINAGMVQVGSNTAAGIGSIALNNNATLQSGGAAITLANNVETTANGLVNVRTGEVQTLNGSVGGAGSISQVGGGNLVLNGANSFTNLGINTGTVTLGTNTAAGVG
ncbi:MAG: beta strand repeat-containing protein, partial [Polymorphobacter sp.]